jgi:glyceraldehyde 3-phosphate dehydrogenase
MTTKVGINGFGRIGRSVLKCILDDPECSSFEISGINDLTDSSTLAHLLKYDSVQGVSALEVQSDFEGLIINGKHIKIIAESDPKNLPWQQLGVDIVIESTGLFTKREAAKKHIEAGAKKVIISAPATGADLTIVLGVNEQAYISSKHHIISNASCTTNCLAPVVKVMIENFGIKKGLMTTIHSYTNDQKILDLPHSDLRRARAANLSMIPTSTGAAKAVELVLPEIKGKLDGMAIRVPTPNVSLIDLVVEVEKNTSIEEVNQSLRKESERSLNKIIRFEEKPLVSIDFNGDACSSVIDGISTKVIEGNMVKVLSWYDNEWGYSNRVKDLLKFIG